MVGSRPLKPWAKKAAFVGPLLLGSALTLWDVASDFLVAAQYWEACAAAGNSTADVRVVRGMPCGFFYTAVAILVLAALGGGWARATLQDYGGAKQVGGKVSCRPSPCCRRLDGAVILRRRDLVRGVSQFRHDFIGVLTEQGRANHVDRRVR